MAHLTKCLRGQVVIAFRSNLSCFWEIWSVVSSTPRSGRWIFFSVQINYYKLFLYAYIFYNDKKQSKVLSNLSKITLNFWTVCSTLGLYYVRTYVSIKMTAGQGANCGFRNLLVVFYIWKQHKKQKNLAIQALQTQVCP